jgi:hypothetical protein
MAGQCVIASAEITSCKTTDEGATNGGKSGTQEIRFYLHLKKVIDAYRKLAKKKKMKTKMVICFAGPAYSV